MSQCDNYHCSSFDEDEGSAGVCDWPPFSKMQAKHTATIMLSMAWLLLLLLLSTVVADETNDEISTTTYELRDGRFLPRVGLGVALTGDDTYEAVAHALRVGYRLVDTAAEESYGNEDAVGRAALNTSTTYITTKLWDTDHGFYHTLRAFFQSHHQLNSLQNSTSQIPIDLYLIHSPFGGRLLETWDALLYLQEHHGDKLHSIGVSNFGIRHLEILRKAGRPMPVVNQIEMHPLVYAQRRELLDYCRTHNIRVQAFGSLLHGYQELMDQSVLWEMAERYNSNGKSYRVYNGNDDNDNDNNDDQPIGVHHILLQWALQHGFAIIPKSSRKDRITDNVKYIRLSNATKTTNIDRPELVLSREDMDILDDWGNRFAYRYRNIYKRDWNWNPIDEAPVHVGREHFWPGFENLTSTQKMEDVPHEDDDYWGNWGEEYDDDEEEDEYGYDEL